MRVVKSSCDAGFRDLMEAHCKHRFPTHQPNCSGQKELYYTAVTQVHIDAAYTPGRVLLIAKHSSTRL